MQLLKITTVPIKYKEQENIPVDSGSSFSLETVEKNSANVQIPVANTSGSRNNAEKYSENEINGAVPVLQRGADTMKRESASEAEGNEYSVNYCYGRKNITPEPKNNCSAYLRNNLNAGVSIDSAIDSIDSIIPDKSWEPDVKEHSSQVKAPEPEPRRIVEEFAHVEIEYLGGFNYVPKSSAPDYEEPEQ